MSSLTNSRRSFTLLLAFWCAVFCAAAQAQTPGSFERGVVVKRTYDFAAAQMPQMEYALFVPTSYNPKKPTPLIVLLHALTSNPQQVMGYRGIQEQAEKRGYLIAAPFGYNTGGWYGSRGTGKNFALRNAQTAQLPDNLGELSEQDVLNVFDIVRKEFNVDPRRTYLMGHSMGGGGTFYLGMKYPDWWAALAPMAPAIYTDPDQLKSIRDIPVIVVQGDKDSLVSVDVTRKWVAKMKELGMTHRYIEIKDGNHFSSITANPDMIEQVFDFFDKHKKKKSRKPRG
jgi:predicted peptidase